MTSNPTHRCGAPDRSTAAAASGSIQTLNSPDIPRSGMGLKKIPPMITISLIAGATAGSSIRAPATLVSGPMATIVISPGSASTWRAISTAA